MVLLTPSVTHDASASNAVFDTGVAISVIATDEIGKEEDIAAIENALTAGTSLLATIHGGNRKDLEKSRVSHLIEHGVFQNIIFLDRHPALGSIKQMLHRDERSGKWIDY